jgi:PLP dependent protein
MGRETTHARATLSLQPRVVAVSKRKPVEMVRELYEHGHRHFGENYVGELVDKASQLPDDVAWHFIGTLQRNKVKALVSGVPNLFCVESVDTERLASRLDAACASEGRAAPLRVYLQVNTSSEPQKGGCEPDKVVELARHVSGTCKHLQLAGLMTIGRSGVEADMDALVASRRAVCEALGWREAQLELSMGMSADFELAATRGSTSVRVGTSIFGPREDPKYAEVGDAEEREAKDERG